MDFPINLRDLTCFLGLQKHGVYFGWSTPVHLPTRRQVLYYSESNTITRAFSRYITLYFASYPICNMGPGQCFCAVAKLGDEYCVIGSVRYTEDWENLESLGKWYFSLFDLFRAARFPNTKFYLPSMIHIESVHIEGDINMIPAKNKYVGFLP